MQRDFLTSERLKALFKSNFELANYAMGLARYKIMAGHEVSVDDLLDEILSSPHRYGKQELLKMTEEAKQKYSEQLAQEKSERHHERR